MDRATEMALQRHLNLHHGVVTAAEAMQLGMSPSQVQRRRQTGLWRTLHRGVYVLAGVEVTSHVRLYAACCAGGGRAAQWSAAWLWGLVGTSPTVPQIVTMAGSTPQREGIELHRHRGALLDTAVRSGIPVTGPLQTLVDLAGVANAATVDGFIDDFISRRLVAPAVLAAQVGDRGRSGSAAHSALRATLRRRGLLEPPDLSVLERQVLRLLHEWRIPVLAVQHVVLGGRYRIDFLLRADVIFEVDGFSYHSTPRAKAADTRRRNRLLAAGYSVVGADWVLVRYEADGIHDDLVAALSRPPGPVVPGSVAVPAW